MGQKINIECQKCGLETYDAEKFVMVVWTERGVGLIYHDASTADLRLAAARITARATKESMKSDHRN